MATRLTESLFDSDIKSCTECHRDLPKDYPEDTCPACKERLLFSKVKDFIRENDVTEFDVAKEFDIPLFKVKGWIREGRIEYKDLQPKTMKNLHCESCGKEISFGSLCTECLRKSNISGSASAFPFSNDEEEKFRFLQK
jgi:RecJ-like exonuclease